MKFTLVVAAAGLAAAQSLSDVPACAAQCLAASITKAGCSLTDVACSCEKAKQTAIAQDVVPCLLSSCTNPADLASAQQVGTAICAAYSAALSSPSASATTTKAATSTSMMTTTAAPSTTASVTMASNSTTAAPSSSVKPVTAGAAAGPAAGFAAAVLGFAAYIL